MSGISEDNLRAARIMSSAAADSFRASTYMADAVRSFEQAVAEFNASVERLRETLKNAQVKVTLE